MENCVVCCGESVRLMRGSDSDSTGSFIRESKRRHRQEHRQQQHTFWLRYFLANYFSNKNDIFDKNILLASSSVCPRYGSILTPNGTIGSDNSKASGSPTEILKASNNHNIGTDAERATFGRESQNRVENSTPAIPRTELTLNPIGGQIENDDYEKLIGSFGTQKQYKRRSFASSSSISVISLITLVLLALDQNAPLCSGSSRVKRFDSYGFFGYNLPPTNQYHQPTSMTPFNFYPNNLMSFYQPQPPQHSYYKRSYSMDDPTLVTPTFNSPGSLSNDVSPGMSSSITPAALNSAGWSSLNPVGDTLDTHIRNILVPRVSGTQGNIEVREYIVDALKANNYQVELDEFTDPTPIGNVKFANIIADTNPKACRQLTLACHYDSKMMEGFLGATDSAVPCAMLLVMSEKFKDSFKAQGNVNDRNSLGLRFIFFDGEEAFKKWGPTDSLYGSRHLAAKWEKQPAPKHCSGLRNELKRLELLIVLDLIGASDTSFCMYNRQLSHHYQALINYERAYLKNSGLANINGAHTFRNVYHPLRFIEDDHVPFMQRGVPILSLLANPFPQVWHTVADNYTAIDFPKTRQVLHILEEFVINYKK